MIKRGARTQDTATAFAGYGTGNRTPALVRYKNESINRLVTCGSPSGRVTSFNHVFSVTVASGPVGQWTLLVRLRSQA